ncbi:MAG TPA: phosphoketolase family protein [Gemmatimonadaceae bacterium]|nr:phosphoketolase family protein [Gemmatimonadaceae bacterium]
MSAASGSPRRDAGVRDAAAAAIPEARIRELDANFRAANYLAVAQLYLRDNPLLREPLRAAQIKPRLLGHWGTVPGINLTYAHTSRLAQDTGASVLFVVGTGHGAPGVLACEWLDGTLGATYPRFAQSLAGVEALVREFSWPGGMPSHLTALTPGTLHEGGELGYSLLHAFGAVLDDPGLLAVCLVGDGEAETGPLAASWQYTRFLNPALDGAVLPILHLNGYKLSGPALLARIGDRELREYFRGMGLEAREVSGDDPVRVHHELWRAMDWAYHTIRGIQRDARDGRFQEQPLWPAIILRTPKGWTDPKMLDGRPLEGTFHSHQVPIEDPARDPGHLRVLEEWMRSYRPEELFDEQGRPVPMVTAIYPREELRLGRNPRANGGALRVPLPLPDYAAYGVEVPMPGSERVENTRVLGGYLRDVFAATSGTRDFRLFCPDETSSNRLQAVFEATQRAWMLPQVPSDEHLARDGRVMEILSEHCCEGWLEGYLLTGRHGVFACYEAFLSIVDSMMQQYAKWLKMARETGWRAPVASLNYVVTSHVWEQDHNGYSHQGPSFINMLLTKKPAITRVYLPPDANCLLSVADHCLRSLDYVNLIVTSKKPMPQWLSMDAAREHCAKGAGVWEWAGSEEGGCDIVLAAAGDVPTREAVAAAWWLRREVPGLRVRVVNVVDLFALQSPRDHPHGLEDEDFERLFGTDTEVVMAFHGYPSVIHQLLHHRPNPQRFHVRGYIEEGTTTTPFDMTVLNRMSRYDLAIAALERVGREEAVPPFERKLRAHRAYILEHDEDMPEVQEWRWSPAGAAAGPPQRGVTERY